jgi:hypothetical protein
LTNAAPNAGYAAAARLEAAFTLVLRGLGEIVIGARIVPVLDEVSDILRGRLVVVGVHFLYELVLGSVTASSTA